MASTQPATKSLPNPTADDATPRGLSTGQTAQTTIPEMKHWAMIFPAASVEFQKMPDVVAPKDPKPEYDIRIARTWAEVDVKITAAQAHYTNTTGFSGSLRRAWRWSADNVTEPIALATKFVPQTDISMPVLGAVQMILEAVQTGATVRGESLKGLEDLDDVLGDVDLFVSTFLRKDSIRSKAIGLVAVILLAVERVLRFWTRPGLFRAGRVLLQGKQYEEKMIESLGSILSHSKKLMAEGVKAHITDFHAYSKATHRIHDLIVKKQEDIAVAVNVTNNKLDELNDKADDLLHIASNIEWGITARLDLLMEKYEQEKRKHDEERKELLEREKLAEERLAAEREKNAYLAGMRSVSPMLDPPFQPPPRTSTPFDRVWLWGLKSFIDVDVSDVETIDQERGRLPLRDRAQVEAILRSPLFEDWIVAPTSAKLLIHGNFLGLMVQTSALSLFCTTLTQSFRMKQRYICLVWFCGRHMIEDETGEDMYDSSDDSDDGWFKNDCGESYDNGTRAGPIRMMLRSLIAQLLCDYDYNMRTELPPHVDSFLLEQGNIEQLSLVLVWLIRQLPWDVTLFCLVDGIVFYEREEFENPMLDAMGPILGLAADEYVSATVKVLVTSPWPTSTVRLAFEPEADGDEAKSWVLSMQTLPQMYLSPTDERMVRELSTMEEYLK